MYRLLGSAKGSTSYSLPPLLNPSCAHKRTNAHTRARRGTRRKKKRQREYPYPKKEGVEERACLRAFVFKSNEGSISVSFGSLFGGLLPFSIGWESAGESIFLFQAPIKIRKIQEREKFFYLDIASLCFPLVLCITTLYYSWVEPIVTGLRLSLRVGINSVMWFRDEKSLSYVCISMHVQYISLRYQHSLSYNVVLLIGISSNHGCQ